MLVVTYILKSTRAKYNQYKVKPQCLLCGAEEEDMPHFLRECPALSKPRKEIMSGDIQPTARKLGKLIPANRVQKCRLILNGGWGAQYQSKHTSRGLVDKKTGKIRNQGT